MPRKLLYGIRVEEELRLGDLALGGYFLRQGNVGVVHDRGQQTGCCVVRYVGILTRKRMRETGRRKLKVIPDPDTAVTRITIEGYPPG